MHFGKLQKVDLREAWRHEATDFTPWLAQEENIQALADSLGLDQLEVVGTEYPVGEFKLDILCSDEDGEVIVENQLEPTNHTHLGQILTYAAGVGATKVIWIAKRFRPEHVAALEYLNSNTTPGLDFFAIEMQLFRIGESPMAPSFKVVVKPNDWSKSSRANAKAAGESTPTKLLQQKFWSHFLEYTETVNASFRPQKPRPQHWSNIALGRTGFKLGATFNSRDGRLGMEVYIFHDKANEFFHELAAQQEVIEERLGFELDWQELPEKNASRIIYTRDGCHLEDEGRWPEYLKWLTEMGDRFLTVFKPIVRDLREPV